MLKFQPTALCLAVAVLAAAACHRTAPPGPAQHVYELREGRWLGADGFRTGTRWIVDRRITTQRPARVDSVIDLAGRWVVPPFGEAHNHNIDYSTRARTDSLIRRYLRDGVFYVKNPGSVPRGRDSLVGRINVPRGVDAVFAYGLLTATGGHPTGLYLRNRARGAMTPADSDGGFLWILDSLPDLERKWPRILAGRPDFIKVVLVHSEEFARRRTDTAFFNWRGLDPALVPEIVRRAHAVGLRVSAHVETAADFHTALVSGVDEINHIPGFRGDVLHGAGVRLAIGSDAYRDDSVAEVTYLATLGVFTPLQLLRLWSEATPRAIFPQRRVGCLDDGCEASLLVLDADPSADFASTKRITLRMKDGRLLP